MRGSDLAMGKEAVGNQNAPEGQVRLGAAALNQRRQRLLHKPRQRADSVA
jgi:hypothetical protein